MFKQLLTVSLLVTSTVLAYTPPSVWECDAPGTQGFFISDEPVSFQDAPTSCAKHGGVLADIDNQNFLLATDMILNCVGQNQNAWIRTWDYNTVNPEVRNCLAIYVGFTGPGGGINTLCGNQRYSLCSYGTKTNNTVQQYTSTPTPPTFPIINQSVSYSSSDYKSLNYSVSSTSISPSST